ncbi:contractile injection system protein, VgrG/Pvc8 family [Sorangium sp. So ce834]|uniref:phage late control D family protein n=1 Tax=Sorangium sp. So ce834 TaxID=3133321 RepID=UPI003F5D71AC
MAETQLSTLPQYRARPTVRLDGNTRDNARVSALINAFRVTEQEMGLSSLELRLSNQTTPPGGGNEELALEDERDIKLGTKISLYSGDENRPREIFRGVVSCIEAEFPQKGSPELLVLAEDPLQKVRLSRRTQVHDHLRLSDLANQLASQMSLSPRVTGFTEDIGTHVQLNESDLAFLRRLLARYDGDVQVVGDALHVSPRKDVQRGTGTVELAWNSQLFHARFCADLADQVTEVTTSGWDPKQGVRVAGSSQGANLGPGGGRLGSQILSDVFGARSEHVSSPAVLTDLEARALADAAFDQRARRFVRVSGTAEGNPLIRVGTLVRLTRMSRRFNNTYYVVHACHRFQKTTGQYETDFQAESAYLGNP